MKTIILLTLLMATVCFSQRKVTEVYVYTWGNNATVETFTWGEDRSQTSEYYFYGYGEPVQDYGIYGNYILWGEILKEDDCEQEEELYYWEDEE